MAALIFQHKYFMTAILILLSLSIICQIAIGVIYYKLIRETENMSITSNKSLQQLKLKFSSCVKVNKGVPNVMIFVDKFMNQIKIGPFSLSAIKHLSGQLMLLAIFVAGIGACRAIIAGENFFSIAPFYVGSFLGLYCYFSVSSLIDAPGKSKILRTNLIDYLENHMANKIEQTSLDMLLIQHEKPDSETSAAPAEAAAAQMPAKNTPPQDKKESAPVFTSSEAEELELLLREFLT